VVRPQGEERKFAVVSIGGNITEIRAAAAPISDAIDLLELTSRTADLFRLQPVNEQQRFFKIGSPAWIRTTIHGSKGRCPTIRRPGISWRELQDQCNIRAAK
jgi:hypothetical protein